MFSTLILFIFFVPTFLTTFYLWFTFCPAIFSYLCAIPFLLVVSWTIGYYLFEFFIRDTIKTANKIVLVTGCDTGFGNRVAYKLDQLGFHVYAGVLFPSGDGAQELERKCSNRLKIRKMDVTNEQEVDSVVEEIEKTGIPLWGIINNAGIGVGVPFDWGKDVDVYKRIFDVNVFGLVRVTKRCSPLLRKSKGRIVNIASAAGRVTAPTIAHYCMAKHSVRVFSDVIRRELMDAGIKVTCLEPSFYRTQIINFETLRAMRRKIYDETPEYIKQYYGESYFQLLDIADKRVESISHGNIDDVVDCMVAGIARKHPKAYYRCCKYSEVITIWAVYHLPEVLIDVFWMIVNKLNKMKMHKKRA